MAKGRKFVFPEPGNTQLKNNAVFCANNRIIALYNQAHGEQRKRMTPKIESWFAREARNTGWAGGNFLKDSQTRHSAGCVLFVPPQELNVQITQTTLILQADNPAT